MHRLVLLRHGESEWNELNLFTGWYDCDLTDKGRDEAAAAGAMLTDAAVAPDVVHTSLQLRAIRTANLALESMGRLWVPVRRSWRLNERHYGELTGKDKRQTVEQFGEEQVQVWRRSYDVAPPPIAADNPYDPGADERYASLPPELVPTSECLADVVVRMLPYWYDAIVPDLAAGATVAVAAHGNSLRALVKHLLDISNDDITGLNIPTGVPMLFELDDAFRPAEEMPIEQRYLMDEVAVRARADAVARQSSGK